MLNVTQLLDWQHCN